MKNALIGVVLISLLSLGCFQEEEEPGSPKWYDPATPANVLRNIAIAFNNCDGDLLRDMISDDFVFYFDPSDVGRVVGGNIIPEYWTYDEFREATMNLFSQAYSVKLTVDADHVGEPGAGTESYYAPEIETFLVVMVDEVSGFSGGSLCDYEFEAYEGKAGGEFWHLTKWTDKKDPRGDSVGIILAYYAN